MADDPVMTQWQEVVEETLRELRGWRTDHRRATFAEIEGAVEQRLGDLRAELIGGLVRSAGDEVEEEPRVCEQCGQQMESRGVRERVVTVRGDRPVRFQRRYRVCPACGAGFSPSMSC
jgi:ribosomal protein S27AE